ncbi:MAG: dienelactone hydrolase family protein [Acidobacteriota bacterium]
MRGDRQNVYGTDVEIPIDGAVLKGDLCIPEHPQGAVLFAHGSGSSRRSPRNQYVAGVLQASGIATLLLDLLTDSEEIIDAQTRHLRFDIHLLTRRLHRAGTWLLSRREMEGVKLGCFGASTGAAAALMLAAEMKEIAAVVSRGGRPDLAGPALARVNAPVLLIVGGNDETVLELNREALIRLPGQKKIEVVPGATHLFEEPGALEQVAHLARNWFGRYLASERFTRRAA